MTSIGLRRSARQCLFATAGVLALAACSQTQIDAFDAKVDALKVKWGQDVAAFSTFWDNAKATLNTGAADLGQLVQAGCAVGNVLNGAFAEAAPLLGASVADVVDEGKAMDALGKVCAAPTVTDLKSAALTVTVATETIKSALGKTAPAIAAAKPAGS